MADFKPDNVTFFISEFQQRTFEFQRQMLRLQQQTIDLLHDIKQNLEKSTPPSVSQIQESLASIQDHEKEKSYLLLDGNSSHSHAVSDEQMEQFENQQQSPQVEPPETVSVEALQPFGWQSPLSSEYTGFQQVLKKS